LVFLAIAVLVVILVLPSSLNLPQSNPSTVLEYAPVPPQDKNPPPVTGNLSSLGLGSSRTLAQGGVKPPKSPTISGIGGNPRQFQCVGNPPRQTEDPSSPPCVPFFQGDNFGATYQGVSKNEIRVLVYLDQAGAGNEGPPPADTYVDIDSPPLAKCPPTFPAVSDPKQCDFAIVREVRAFAHYFTARFQTYNRRLHYFVYFSGAGTAAQRRSDAVSNWQKLRPFAVIDQGRFNGFNQEYEDAMNQLRVLSFSSTLGALPNSFYRKNAPLSWGFFPDIEHWAALYSSYVCKKVAPYPVHRYGNPSVGPPNGQKRKIGLWYTTDPGFPGPQYFAQLVKKQIESCGLSGLVERTYSKNGYAVDGSDTGTEATQAAADFQTQNVTTILYLGGTETRLSNALDSIKYYPEIVVAGNLHNDNNFIGQVQNQNSWRNAWVMSFAVRENRRQDSPGYRAYKEGNPSGDEDAGGFAVDDYRDHFNLVEGIQVAGPRLTPQSIDKGFHAIPPHSSSDPYSPALFFDPGDYSAAKDAAEGWWDPTGSSPSSNQKGCWRLVRNGQRFRAGLWVGGDDVFRNTSDPCTGYGGTINFRG
jgi:hypothetical protein